MAQEVEGDDNEGRADPASNHQWAGHSWEEEGGVCPYRVGYRTLVGVVTYQVGGRGLLNQLYFP